MKFLPARINAILSTLNPNSANPQQTKQASVLTPRRRLYACHRDKHGLFVRLIHTTSSANLEKIREFGLTPFKVGGESLKQYLMKVAPQHELTINRLIDAWSVNSFDANSKCARSHGLVQIRYGHGNKVYLLSLRNSRGYLEAAADNAVYDGGEIFFSARKALECVTNDTIQPLYPDATRIVVICKFRLSKESSHRFIIPRVDGFGIEFTADGIISGLQGASSEISSTRAFGPNGFEFMSISDFLRMETEQISPAAQKLIVELVGAEK